MSYGAYLNLCNSKQVRDYAKFIDIAATYGEIAPEVLARYLGLKHVLISDAVYNSGTVASPTVTPIWDDDTVYVTRVAENIGSLNEPCFGRTFAFISDGKGDVVISSYRFEKWQADIIRAQSQVGPALVFSDLAFAITGCKTSVTTTHG
jgi:hypothetical protein